MPRDLGIRDRPATEEELGTIAKALFVILEPRHSREQVSTLVEASKPGEELRTVFVTCPGSGYYMKFDLDGNFQDFAIALAN